MYVAPHTAQDAKGLVERYLKERVEPLGERLKGLDRRTLRYRVEKERYDILKKNVDRSLNEFERQDPFDIFHDQSLLLVEYLRDYVEYPYAFSVRGDILRKIKYKIDKIDQRLGDIRAGLHKAFERERSKGDEAVIDIVREDRRLRELQVYYGRARDKVERLIREESAKRMDMDKDDWFPTGDIMIIDSQELYRQCKRSATFPYKFYNNREFFAKAIEEGMKL